MEHTPATTLPPASAGDEPGSGPGASRRFFLAGTGALALAASTGGTAGFQLGRVSGPASSSGPEAASEGTVIAYVRPGESEVTVMSGDREVVVDDPALARALARIVGER